jgi:hypothetical protein
MRYLCHYFYGCVADVSGYVVSNFRVVPQGPERIFFLKVCDTPQHKVPVPKTTSISSMNRRENLSFIRYEIFTVVKKF